METFSQNINGKGKNMEKILSIVIPSYNVEKYIDKCVRSMLVDSILDDIEILIVNDGSKDSTPTIAQGYVEKYPQTVRLIDKENGGHGSTINAGIREATGKYFKVVDGDDWLNTPNLERFVEILKNVDVDVVASNYLCIQDETYDVLSEKRVTSDKSFYGTVRDMDKGEVNEVIKMHALTIRTSILKENNIVIDEHCFYVDAEYIAYPMPYVKTVYYDEAFIYMYRLGRNGQSVDIRSMQRNRAMHMKVLQSLQAFYDTLPQMTEEKKSYIEKVICQVMENQFQIYISMGTEKEIQKETAAWDKELCQKYPRIAAATTKKSIVLLRKTNYCILPIGSWILKIVKGYK